MKTKNIAQRLRTYSPRFTSLTWYAWSNLHVPRSSRPADVWANMLKDDSPYLAVRKV